MRSLPGELGRQRRNHELPSLVSSNSSSNGQMSFFLADEASVDSFLEQPTISSNFRDARKHGECKTGSASCHRDDKDHASACTRANSPLSRDSNFAHSPMSTTSQNVPAVSRPLTPMMLGTPFAGSAMSSPSSRRNSLTSSLSEHAVEFDEETSDNDLSGMLESSIAPQLVMPSIKMPSRRPFTEEGKNMGRLKVLLAGGSDVGKTSLIKAIVQTCEHIVHVDPISPSPDLRKRTSKSHDKPVFSRRSSSSSNGISEIYASTKPYPEWWSNLDEPLLPERRKSLGDNVLERNICFVDTTGYGEDASAMEPIIHCVEYVESHLTSLSSDSLADSDMLNMLGGDGSCQVDVVFYLISHRLKPIDLDYIRRLVPLTNVIPVLAQTDSLSSEQIRASKEEIADQLRDADIRPFSFNLATCGDDTRISVPKVPYTVSSTNVSDRETMDASLLMSPGYVQPLSTTELDYLVNNTFSPNGASWLRHAAAKKFLQWKSAVPARPHHLYRPLSTPVSRQSTGPAIGSGNTVGPSTSLALTRISEGRDENAQQLHLVDWAADLQRSLATERVRYESLARGERAVWLTERLSECVQDGTLVAVRGSGETSHTRRRGAPVGPSRRTEQHQDPLGLLQIATDLKARGRGALELLGSLGVIGLAVWMTGHQRHQWRVEPDRFAEEWARFWGMDI